MSNTDKLREIATRHFPVEEKLSNNSLYNQLQQSSQDNLLSDLTALISENYVEKAKYDELLRQRDKLLAACKEFVRKVECGEARSVRSYAQMKAAIKNTEG